MREKDTVCTMRDLECILWYHIMRILFHNNSYIILEGKIRQLLGRDAQRLDTLVFITVVRSRAMGNQRFLQAGLIE